MKGDSVVMLFQPCQYHLVSVPSRLKHIKHLQCAQRDARVVTPDEYNGYCARRVLV